MPQQEQMPHNRRLSQLEEQASLLLEKQHFLEMELVKAPDFKQQMELREVKAKLALLQKEVSEVREKQASYSFQKPLREVFGKNYGALFQYIVGSEGELKRGSPQFYQVREAKDNEEAHWSVKCVMVSALTIGLAQRFDVQKVNLLLEFIEYREEQVWERALYGLIITLHRFGNRLEDYPHTFRRLSNLSESQIIQTHLIGIAEAIGNAQRIKSGRATDSERLLLKWLHAFGLKRKAYPFFEKPENWFLPFYPEHEAAFKSLSDSQYDLSPKRWMQLLDGSLSFSSADKYFLCFFLNELSGSEFESLNKGFLQEQQYASLYNQGEEQAILHSQAIYGQVSRDYYAFEQFYQSDSADQQLIHIDPYRDKIFSLVASKGFLYLIQAKYEEALGMEVDKAIELYQQGLKNSPNLKWAWNTYGALLKDQGQLAEAVQAYEKSIELDHQYHKAWNNLGVAQQGLGQLEKAEEAYQKALEIYPDHTSTLYNLASLYALKGEKDGSIACLKKVVGEFPDEYAKLAGKNPDFNFLRQESAFQALTQNPGKTGFGSSAPLGGMADMD